MKKLYMLLISAIVAIAANAAVGEPIYLMGSGTGLSWESFPGMVVQPQTDGSYQFTIANLSSFKMSVNKATTWDGDGEFNAGAFGYSGSFGDAVFNAAGQTVSLDAWGENQDMPYPGSYTVTVNSERTSMTVKANFNKPTNAPEVFIRGGMNSWGSGAAWKFENVSWDGTSGTWTWTGTINAGVEFKIADANWGNINYSTNGTITTFNSPISLTYNQQNSKFSEQFVGTITLKITNYTGHQATATFSTGGDATYPESMYILGEVNGNSWASDNGVLMTGNGEGQYTATGVTVSGTGYFSFTENLAADWSELTRYGSATGGDTEVVLGQAMPITGGDAAFYLTTGTYTIVVDLKEMTMTATKETTPDPEIPPTFGLVGDSNIQTAGEWDINNPVEMTANDNVWTTTYSSLPAGAKFKVAVSNSTLANKWDDTYGAENNADGGGDVDVVLGEAMNAWLASSNNWTIAEDLKDVTISFTYVADGQSTVKVTGTPDSGDEPVNPDQPLNVTFNFTEYSLLQEYVGNLPEVSEWTIDSSAKTNRKYDVSKMTNDGIEITLEKDASATVTVSPACLYAINGAADTGAALKYDFRLYKNNNMTLTAPTGYAFKVMDFETGGTASNMKYLTSAAGTLTITSKTAQWVAPEEANITTLLLTSPGGTTRLDYIDITLEKISTGVDNIVTEFDANAPVEYYNLQGIRVNNPENGIFIMRQGNTVKKVVK